MNVNRPPADTCHDKELKIIGRAVKVIELCADMSTERKNKHNTAYLLCFYSCVCVRWCCCFICSTSHSLLVFHFHFFHYFPVSEFHLNSTDYTLFLNDHSWGLWIQKPFRWLGPLGLPYITNHIRHWGLSTCKAYTYLDEHKSYDNELKGFFSSGSVCLCWKKEYFIYSALVISLVVNRFTLYSL